MKYKEEFNTLVLLGQWNNFIFTPEWISKYLLKDETIKAEYPININGSVKNSTEDMRIFTLDGKLNFAILKKEDDVFRKIGEIAYKIADYLPHTPVIAFGMNYIFENEITTQIKECFKMNCSDMLLDDGFTLNNMHIKHSFKKDNYMLNITIIKKDEKCFFDFNYHFEIKTLVDFKQIFDTDSLIKFKNKSLSLLENLYQLKLS